MIETIFVFSISQSQPRTTDLPRITLFLLTVTSFGHSVMANAVLTVTAVARVSLLTINSLLSSFYLSFIILAILYYFGIDWLLKS